VGILGSGRLANSNGAWGGNFVSSNWANGLFGPGIFGNLWGIENDLNSSADGSAPANAWGTTNVSAMYKMPVGDSVGTDIQKAEVVEHPHSPFKVGFRTKAGAAQIGVQVGPTQVIEASTKTFATLPTAPTGFYTAYRCTDCQQTNPCLGGGTGAVATGFSGTWDCSPTNSWSQAIELNGINPTSGLLNLSRIYSDGSNLVIGNQGAGGAAALIGFQSPLGTPTVGIWPGGGAISQTGTAFGSLGSAIAGKFVYCTDCSVATPCSGSGSGAWAFANGSQWKCPF
jgi:hypothetical protein